MIAKLKSKLEKGIENEIGSSNGISRLIKVFIDSGFYFVDENKVIEMMETFKDIDCDEINGSQIRSLISLLLSKSWLGFKGEEYILTEKEVLPKKIHDDLRRCQEYMKVSFYSRNLRKFVVVYENMHPNPLPERIKHDILQYLKPEWEIRSFFSPKEEVNDAFASVVEDYFSKEMNKLNLFAPLFEN